MHLLLLVHLGLASFPLHLCIEFFCPSTSQWFKRAQITCDFADQYYCLYDDNNRKYTEICQDTPTFDSAGHKVVFVGGIQGVDCEHDIYQPFKYWTNGSSTCAFKKTPCNAEGQVIYENGTTKTDRQCRCDYSRGYDFIKKPKSYCYCEPSKEDCSCYQKECAHGFVLTPGYNCIRLKNWSMTFACSMIPDNTDIGNKARPLVHISERDGEKDVTKSSLKLKIVITTLIGFATILIGICVIWLLNNPIPQHFIDIQIRRKQQWKKQFYHFIETHASTAILDSIRLHQLVIVSGPAGCGKSSSTFNAAMNLEETGGFDMWIISDPDDILKYFSAKRKQIFFIDDAFGKYSLNEHITGWCSVKDTLKENPNLKIVMTCRSYIYRSVTSMETIKPFHNVDLLSKHLKLTITERRTIAKWCINQQTENIDKISNEVIMLYSFFPSLCSKFHEVQNDIDMIEYFTFPVNYIEEEVKQFQTADDPLYLALAFLVIRGNKVKKEVLNSDSTIFDKVIECLSKHSGFKGKSPKSKLLPCFDALKDLYVSENELSFEFIHENLFIMIAHCVGPDILKIILDHGESSLIKERVRLELIGENTCISKYDILVSEKLIYRYFRRLITDLQNGKSYIVFSSSQHTVPKFRELFSNYLVEHLKERLEGDGQQKAMDVVSALGYKDYFQVLKGLE